MIAENLSDPIVSVEWLSNNLNNPDLIIVDCRFTLGQPTEGTKAYQLNHIPYAVRADLELDLSAEKNIHGGRHPLLSVEQMEALCSRLGIGNSSIVVAYDDDDMSKAGRFWWMLRYVGHSQVYVLDGGYSAWKKAEHEITSDKITPTPQTFKASPQIDLLVYKNDVEQRAATTPLLDSRAGERFRGEVEPLDKKAGHIPGAQCYFYKETLNEDGTMKTTEELKKHFSDLLQQEEIIVYCGSGVTATVNLLALVRAGRPDAKLYAGSWSDWSSYEDSPVATGDK